MELIVRGSEYQSFLTCRKQWYYQWVEELEPKRPDGKLFFGTLFHKWLEIYYNNGCNKLISDLEASVWFHKQDMSAMEQTEIDDIENLLIKVAENYHNTYGESDKQWNILATELEFVVKLTDDIYYTGTIDLVYEVDGKVRFVDHKTVASLSMYEEKSKMDRQISRYWWALKQIAAGVGLIKDYDTEGKAFWREWDTLKGKTIDGFDYNLIAKDFPKEPKVLKSGKLSTDKSQKTTYDKYLKALGHDVNISELPTAYREMLDHLASKPDQFLKRVNVLRNDKELESAIWEFLYTSKDIKKVKEEIEYGKARNPQVIEEVTYRNIGTHCEHMCSFKDLCKTTIEGGNVSLVKNLGYKTREEK